MSILARVIATPVIKISLLSVPCGSFNHILSYLLPDCSSPDYEGWDNPFREEGEVSQDAQTIIRLWREGKLR